MFVALAALAAGTLSGCDDPRPGSTSAVSSSAGWPEVILLDSAALDTETDDPRMEAALVGAPPTRAKLTLPGLAVYTYPTSGCLAAARAAVAGGTATWARLSYLPAEINLRLHPATTTDPRYLAAQDMWKQCMADHGRPYATPAAIRADLAQQVSAHPQRRPALHAEEITLAVQDAQCDHQAHLTHTELAMRRTAPQTIDPAQRRQITDLTTALDAAVGRAQEILK